MRKRRAGTKLETKPELVCKVAGSMWRPDCVGKEAAKTKLVKGQWKWSVERRGLCRTGDRSRESEQYGSAVKLSLWDLRGQGLTESEIQGSMEW